MQSERRLHPTSLFFGFSAKLRELLLPAILVLFTAGRTGWGWEVWLVVLLVPYALVSVARYLTLRYRFDADELVIRDGLIFRNERHVPYARIQNLDAAETVVHRLAGVVEVRVQTGGGQEPEGTLRVISRDAYDEMRERVFAGRHASGEEPEPAGAADPTRTLLHLSPRDLIVFGLIENRGLVVLAAVAGIAWEIGFMDRFMWSPFAEDALERDPAVHREAVRQFAEQALGQAGVVFGRALYAFGAFLAVLLLIRVFSAGWALIRLHDYRLTRRDDDLRARFGLLTRVTATIPLRRIQTLTIREGPLHRLLQRASVRVDTAGGHGDQASATQREWLAPIVASRSLPAFVAEILPELNLSDVAWQPVAPGAFRRLLKKSLALSLAAVLMTIGVLGWRSVAVLLLLVPWAIVHARYSVRHLGWAVTDHSVLFRSGWIWRRTTIARFVRVQAVALHESPFDRRNTMARVRVDTAGAGDLSHRVDVPYLRLTTARELRDLVAREAGGTGFQV